MSNSPINFFNIKSFNRTESIQSYSVKSPKKNSFDSDHRRNLIHISPSIFGYKIGKKYTGTINKNNKKNKKILKIENHIFNFNTKINLDINDTVSFKIKSIIRNKILGVVNKINNEIINDSVEIELFMVSNKNEIKFSYSLKDKTERKIINFSNFFHQISLLEKKLFEKKIIELMPSFQTKDPKKIMNLINSIFNSDLEGWLGSYAINALKRNKKNLIIEELQKLEKIKKDVNNIILIIFPFYFNLNPKLFYFEFNFLNMYRKKTIRIKINFEMKKTGRTVIDLLLQEKSLKIKFLYSNEIKKDLLIRLKEIYSKTLKRLNYTGTIEFIKMNSSKFNKNLYQNSVLIQSHKMSI